jgi:hypothetical protein
MITIIQHRAPLGSSDMFAVSIINDDAHPVVHYFSRFSYAKTFVDGLIAALDVASIEYTQDLCAQEPAGVSSTHAAAHAPDHQPDGGPHPA